MSALFNTHKATSRHDMSRVKPNNLNWRKFLKWGAIIITLLVALIVCIFLYVWFNRYTLAERYVQGLLSEQGIEAQLSVKQFSNEHTIIENIKLTYKAESKPFFSAERVEANYTLEDALKGKMKKLRLVEPKAQITLNEKFQIIDGWMPPKSGTSSSGVSIPENGLFIEDASFEFETPFGAPVIDLTANIRGTDQFDATFILSPSSLSYKSVEFDGSARVDLDVSGNKKDIGALFKIDSLTGQTSTEDVVSIENATLNIDGVLTADTELPIDLDLLDVFFQGDISGNAQHILTPPGTMKDSQLDWKGDIFRNTAHDVRVGSKGRLNIKTEDFTVPDPERATALASTLTLSEALSKTPIAQHFGPSVTNVIESLLQGSSFETSVSLDFDHEKGEVSLLTPLNVSKGSEELELNPVADTPFYKWGRPENNISLALNASLNKPVPLTLKGAAIEAATQNGWRLDGIKSFNSAVTTGAIWTAQKEEETARLAPFNATLDYTAGETRRDLTVIGNVDFEGRVPGGYVEGLQTKGRVDIRLAPAGQTGLNLSYKPDNPIISFKSIVTDTDWRLEDVIFRLEQGRNIFRLMGNRSTVKTNISNAVFSVHHETDGRHMDMIMGATDIDGVLNLASKIQNWTLDFSEARMTSDTVPVAGTSIDISEGRLSVEKRPEDVLFDFETPSLDATLPQGQVKGLQVKANGTPTQYDVVHSGGTFDLETADVPNWPVVGDVTFSDNKFIGQAKAVIPKANNTPVIIDYNYSEGAGQANIRIERLIFEPGKLQPQTLLPSFAGKLARVEGVASADLNITFAESEIQASGGLLTLSNMSFGTAPGPITGLNTEIKLTSLFPLRTAGRQILTLDLFDPGVPLENGTIEYDLLPTGILLHSAKWPIGLGNFELDPFTWRYAADENRVVMRLKNIPLNEILDNYADGKLQATGTLTGVFPIVVTGINVLVDKGYVEVPNGGIIRYSADEGDAVTYSQEEALDIIRRQDTPKYRSLARDALREFSYRELRATVDGPLDGDVSLGIIFDGQNKKVLNGQPFEFDIDVQGELFNIMRSFNSNAQIKSQLLRNNLTAVE